MRKVVAVDQLDEGAPRGESGESQLGAKAAQDPARRHQTIMERRVRFRLRPAASADWSNPAYPFCCRWVEIAYDRPKSEPGPVFELLLPPNELLVLDEPVPLL